MPETPGLWVLWDQVGSVDYSSGTQPPLGYLDSWAAACGQEAPANVFALSLSWLKPIHGSSVESFTYTGSLIDEFYFSDRNQTYLLKINPKLAKVFDAGWTRLQWRQRLSLKTNLAKWLYGFYLSHRTPYPVKVETLRNLCGSDCSRISDFRGKIRSALNELTGNKVLAAWKIDQEDKVHVMKMNTNFCHPEEIQGA